jgi:hypothetical protein
MTDLWHGSSRREEGNSVRGGAPRWGKRRLGGGGLKSRQGRRSPRPRPAQTEKEWPGEGRGSNNSRKGAPDGSRATDSGRRRGAEQWSRRARMAEGERGKVGRGAHPKIMENSRVIDLLKRNNFVHRSNFQFKVDFEIQIQHVSEI